MLSKGGLINYKCPMCGSQHITKQKMYGANKGACSSCHTYWPWRTRIKLRVSK